MSLPTSNDLFGLAYCWAGQPFVDVPATTSVELPLLGFAWMGQPFVPNPFPVSPDTGNFFWFFE